MATAKKISRNPIPVPARMRQLYRRLSQAGFEPKFVRDYVLPPTWQDEKADNDSDYSGLLAFLSDHLGIDPASLQDPAGLVAFSESRVRLFRGRDVFEEADATQQVAQGIARVALSGLSGDRGVQVPPAIVLRRQLMLEGKPWVGFRDLLSYCWRIHVPVLHVQHLPAKSAKHKGIAVEVDQAPAIILCQQHASPAWHLKALAHEIGHLTEEDEDLLARPATTEEQVRLAEQAEEAAVRYATQLITGGREVVADPRQYRRTQDLVDATYERASDQKIDPGYLILRRGGVNRNWPETHAALRIINDREGGASARDLINSQILSHINTSGISGESFYFFQRITGVQLQKPYRPLSSLGVGVPSNQPRPGTAPADVYPEDLLARYQTLTRKSWLGELAADREEELVSLRDQIQAISRRDARSQEAARQVKRVNAALAALEEEVDARITQRTAELAGASE